RRRRARPACHQRLPARRAAAAGRGGERVVGRRVLVPNLQKSRPRCDGVEGSQSGRRGVHGAGVLRAGAQRMTALNARDDARVRELARTLGTISLGAPPVLSELVSELRDLLHAEKAAAYRVTESPACRTLDFPYAAGAGPQKQLARDLEQFLARAPARWTGYDPTRPELRQRNRVMRPIDLGGPQAAAKIPIVRDFFPRFGVVDHDQIRVLVCDGATLLAWVGA